MKRTLTFAFLVLTITIVSSCSEEAVEPSTSTSDATGVTVHDENW
ncbi:hypothetical protein [Fulvivirga sp. M361]|nr:hypothetical protein [Fulvivirga sp. M361]